MADFDVPDRWSDEHCQAGNFLVFASTVSTLVACLYMSLIQYLLLKTHRSKPSPKSPTSPELYFVITVLWILHRVLSGIINLIVDTSVRFVLSQDEWLMYQFLRSTHYGYSLQNSMLGSSFQPTPEWNGFSVLIYEVLATWLISSSINTVLDTIIPLVRNIRKDPQAAIVKLPYRCLELLDFARELTRKSVPEPGMRIERPRGGSLVGNEKGVVQVINLKRHQSRNPVKEERILNWDLTIDKSALDEIKETLGPPGGFGELGFNVSGDRVFFGAMGVGTRFNLNFVLGARGSGNRPAGLKDHRRRSWIK
ncbi:hypothetical protein B0O99DRAFT_693242 [Bisporella sp. PMI_857]|nr:hypothetical protein B0O99DRAFT_693242 [Bisporella sp. PMI_857]